jgi:hypothetical protein
MGSISEPLIVTRIARLFFVLGSKQVGANIMINSEQISHLRIGMTRADIVGVLGPPDEETGVFCTDGFSLGYALSTKPGGAIRWFHFRSADHHIMNPPDGASEEVLTDI